MPTYEFPADQFATAWLNVAGAASGDDDRPAICAINFERYRDGMLLVATDSYCLLRSYVRFVHAAEDVTNIEPPLDVLPKQTWPVLDIDGRLKSLLAFARKDAPAAKKASGEMPTVKVEPVRISPEGGLVGLEQPHMRFTYGTEQLDVPQYEGPYPPWRNLIPTGERVAIDNVVLGAALRTIAKVSGESGFALEFHGHLKPVVVEILDTEPALRGLVMPLRDSRYEPPTPPQPQPPAIEGQETFRDVVDRVMDHVEQNIDSIEADLRSRLGTEDVTVSVVRRDGDELLDQARNLVLDRGEASASMLRANLGVGYGRAKKLIDALEAEGIIGPGDGTKVTRPVVAP